MDKQRCSSSFQAVQILFLLCWNASSAFNTPPTSNGLGPTPLPLPCRRLPALHSSFSNPSRSTGGKRRKFDNSDRTSDDNAARRNSSGRRREEELPPASALRTSAGLGPEESSDGGREHFFSRKALSDPSFPSDDLFASLCRAAGVSRPSKIQSLAWPPLVSGSSAIVADQTGSGKTLAYLLPGLYRIVTGTNARKEAEGVEPGGKKRHGAPRMVVLTPTSELADQVKAVCDKIGRNLESSNGSTGDRRYKLSSAVLTATGQYSTDIREQIRLLQRQRVDVLVSTPGRLATILRTRNHNLDLSGVHTLVLDEVDVLLQDDDSFGPQLRTIAAGLGDLDRTQFVFCTATLPDSIVGAIGREFPVGLQQIRGPGLHRVALNLKEHLVDVSVPSASNRNPEACFDLKADCLLDALRKNKCRRTLVFCNTVDSCRDVENLLNRHDRSSKLYSVLPFHNALTSETRNRNLQAFVRGPRRDSAEKPSGRTEPPADSVLVCTDRAARGVDFAAAPVDHVVIFDFPKDPAEYVRRVGRTARAGRPGTCTVFAYGWQLPIARSVMGAKLPGSAGFVVSNIVDDVDGIDDTSRISNIKLRYGNKVGRRNSSAKDDESIKSNIEKGKLWGD